VISKIMRSIVVYRPESPVNGGFFKSYRQMGSRADRGRGKAR